MTEDELGGFDLASLIGDMGDPGVPDAPQVPMPQAPDLSGPKGLRAMTPLLMALPMLLRGGAAGPTRAAAFLAGFQRSQQARTKNAQQDFQNQRLVAGDARATAQAQAAADFRRQTLDGQAAQRRQTLLTNLLGKLEGLDSPEAIDAYMQVALPIAQQHGLRDTSPLTRAADLYKAPSRMQAKAAQKLVGQLEKTYGTDWAAKVGESATFTLPGAAVDPVTGKPQTTSLSELLALTGVNMSGVPQKPKAERPPAALGSFEDYLSATPERRAEIEAARKAYGHADDRPPSAGIGSTILVQTIDANGNPVQRIVPRTAGAEFPTQPSGSQQASMAEQEAGLANVADVERLFKPEYVGPVMGRKTRVQMSVPGVPDVPEAVAEFYAATAGLRNEIIKLMSGAAVSGSEENRMKAQLPDVTDKPSVFRAKLNQTKRNRETLLNRTRAKTGQPQSSGPSIGAMFTHPQYGRVRVVGMNPDGTARVEKVVGP